MKRIIKPSVSTQDTDRFISNKFNLDAYLFKPQLDFVRDESPFKVAVCSRRSGKTISCAAHLIDVATKNKDVTCLYITLSRNNAKKIIWRELKNINENFKLNGSLDETELSITFPNKSTIYLSGAKDSSEIEKFRGLALKLVYIDECQSFRAYIKDLIDDVIAPALIDYAGTLCLIGTPGPIPAGFFHECAVLNENWSKHHWTFWDNPFIPIKANTSHDNIFKRELKRRGVTAEDPSIQREWFGKWVLDSNSLLLKYNETINNYNSLPQNEYNYKVTEYNYVMGVDIGFVDADAICILAWSDEDPTTYLVEEIVVNKQGITELVDQIKLLQKKYDVSKIVMDMGGLGKKIGEELIRRYLIPVEAADKARKMENIELLNDSLRTGKFKAKKDSKFAQDTFLVEKDKDKSTPDKIKVSDKYHSDIIDAVLYAFKLSPAYAYEPPKPKPIPGTKEWADAETDEMFEKTLEFLQKQQENESFD